MTPIRTMLKRKYQVFISSTFSDLAQARQQAVLGVVKAGHFPLALENSSPEPEAKLNVIRDAIAASQYYVILLGHRYGSIGTGQADGQRKSYVELELDYAEKNRLQVLAFVMPRKKVEVLRNKLQRPKDADELDNETNYWALYRRLTEGVGGLFYKPFGTPLEVFVELYAYFSKNHDEVKGYIPEPVAEEDVDIFRISGSNEILREAIQRLGQFTFVDPRLSVAKTKKIALAKAFRQLHGDHVRDKWKKIFIESGSTLAYVAKELAPKLPRMGNGRAERRLITNNSLAYLYLWLCSGVLCHPEPEGPPDNKYGGMFGALTDLDRVPDYRQPPLDAYDPDAVELIRQTSLDIFGEISHNSHSILLAAASGLQLSPNLDIEVGFGHPSEGLSDCRGFHGGSYQNRLFKRCMYETRIPAFLFIHDDKIDCPVRPGICHFLCDAGYPWSDFIGSYPLSIWIACQANTIGVVHEKVQKWFNVGEWTITTYAQATPTPILMASNRAFRESCDKIGVTLYEACDSRNKKTRDERSGVDATSSTS